MTEFKFGDVVRNPGGAYVMLVLGTNTGEAFKTEDGYMVESGDLFGFALKGGGVGSTYPNHKTCKIIEHSFTEKVEP